jgi:hypothetical protein
MFIGNVNYKTMLFQFKVNFSIIYNQKIIHKPNLILDLFLILLSQFITGKNQILSELHDDIRR